MSDFDPIRFGKLEARIDQLERELGEARADIKALLALANQSRGGFWVGMAIASSAGAAASWLIDKVLIR
ncbi:MAG: hypothetical protein KGZ68_04395 [Dechloromonas sp.]|nr:hypothetical protein [Dechloromonas sp.]